MNLSPSPRCRNASLSIDGVARHVTHHQSRKGARAEAHNDVLLQGRPLHAPHKQHLEQKRSTTMTFSRCATKSRVKRWCKSAQLFLFRFPQVLWLCLSSSLHFCGKHLQPSPEFSNDKNLRGDVQSLQPVQCVQHFFCNAASFGCLCEAQHLASK